MKRFMINAGIALALGLGLVLAVLWLLDGLTVPVSAAPGVITVCLGGGCDHTSIQSAVDAASPGDVIKVAQDTYTDVHVRLGITQVVYISKSITIRGGYATTNWDTSYPLTQPSTLDAWGQGRGICVIGTGISVTLEGLHITGGDATGLGGGPSWSPDVGGGVYVASDDLSLIDSRIFSSLADAGGGFYVYQSDHTTLIDNAIYSNTAKWGGAVYVYRGEYATLTGNDMYSNTAINAGGGIYLHLTGYPVLAGNDVYSNTADSSDGGGIYIGSTYGSITLENNRIYNNTINSYGGGGGIYGTNSGDVALTGNEIYGNKAVAQGGGVYLQGCRDATLTDNVIHDNKGHSNGGGLYFSGGNNVTLTGNDIYSNTIDLYGGGIYVNNSDGIKLLENAIHDNTASGDNGGGINFTSCDDVVLKNNEIYNNVGVFGGGLYFWYSNGAAITANEFYDNGAVSGGGIYLYGSGNVRLTNNIVAENRITGFGGGAGLLLSKSTAHLLHTTVARNNVGNKEGVYVGNGAILWMTNTILVSHTTGIRVTADSTATLAATLWGTDTWANGVDWIDDGILITGTLNWWEELGFADPGAGDYHLGPSSVAIDAGIDAGVFKDIDKQPRPYRAFDLGADEYWPPGTPIYTYLPLVLRKRP